VRRANRTPEDRTDQGEPNGRRLLDQRGIEVPAVKGHPRLSHGRREARGVTNPSGASRLVNHQPVNCDHLIHSEEAGHASRR